MDNARARMIEAAAAGFTPMAMLWRDEQGRTDREWRSFPSICDGQFSHFLTLSLPYATEPASVRASPRGDDVSKLKIHSRHKCFAPHSRGRASDLDGRDVPPLLCQLLGAVHVVGERHVDMNLVGLGKQIRRAEIG